MAFESQMARDARIDVSAVLGAVVKRLPRVVLVTAALLAATLVVIMFMPRLYESSASILGRRISRRATCGSMTG